MNNIWAANKTNIWGYKQNHPELIIKDIGKWFPVPFLKQYVIKLVRQSMLCRGINKWLKCRRDLIAYKKIKKHEIKQFTLAKAAALEELKSKTFDLRLLETGEKSIPDLLNYMAAERKFHIIKALLKEKEEVRGSLKAICMTERWQIWENKELKEMNSIECSD